MVNLHISFNLENYSKNSSIVWIIKLLELLNGMVPSIKSPRDTSTTISLKQLTSKMV